MATTIHIGYLPFGNYPYAALRDERLDELLSARYERTLDVLARVPSARMTLALTGQTKELVAREFPRTYRAIRELMRAGRLELTQCPYSHPQTALTPHDSLVREIERDLQVTRRYYNVRPTVFWSPECSWSPYLPRLLHTAGATAIYLRQMPGDEPATVRGTTGHTITAFNLGPRPNWTPASTDDDIRAGFEALRTRIEADPARDRALVLVFGDDLEMAGVEEEALLHERIFRVADALPYVEPVLIGPYLTKNPPTRTIELNDVSNWIAHFRWWSGDTVDIDQNSLAQAIRRDLRAGEALLKRIKAGRNGKKVAARLETLRERAWHDLFMLESTEPKAWRPCLDRRLWGYRHAAQGAERARAFAREAAAPFVPRKTRPNAILVPLVETLGLARRPEIIEVPLRFDKGACFGHITVRLDGQKLPHQLADAQRWPGGSVRSCTLVTAAGLAARSIGAIEIAWDARKTSRKKPPRLSGTVLESDALTLFVNAERGGAITRLTLRGDDFLDEGEFLNRLAFTPTRTLERLTDDAPARVVARDAGELFDQLTLEHELPLGITKQQTIRLYRPVDRILVETRLRFQAPVSLGVYQPWKQNKTDHSLVVGDLRLNGATETWTTLACSPRDVRIQRLADFERPLNYIVCANDWAALSTPEKAVALIADGATNKMDLARVASDETGARPERSRGARLGYDAGSPSQFGPHYNDERHGWWHGERTVRIVYLVQARPGPAQGACPEPVEGQKEALILNNPVALPRSAPSYARGDPT